MKKLCATQEIVKALEKRDTTVLEKIENSYGALLHRIALNLGLKHGDTEECMNDVYLEVWNTIPPAKPNSIRSYICMLMRRIVIDRIRYNSAGKRAGTVYIEVTDELESCLDVENMVIDEICIPEILDTFLGRQTLENREIFLRRYYEFESTNGIARDLSLSSNTVDKRLSRMRVELKRTLAEWGYN